MQLGIGPHPEETELEQYSMGTLVEPRLEAFEEHLFACDSCQDRLLEMDAYVNAMRSASPKARQARQSRWADLFRWPRPAWIATFALSAVVLVAARVWIVAPSSRTEMASVALHSSRGVEGLATTKAPARRPLSLTVDLTELPAFASYRLEIVERTGTTSGLAAGQYYVRLYAPNSELLREFSLKVQ
jgi:anti-sigma factor RsiW